MVGIVSIFWIEFFFNLVSNLIFGIKSWNVASKAMAVRLGFQPLLNAYLNLLNPKKLFIKQEWLSLQQSISLYDAMPVFLWNVAYQAVAVRLGFQPARKGGYWEIVYILLIKL